MLKYKRRGVVFARVAAAKSFLQIAPSTRVARILPVHFLYGSVNDVATKKSASAVSRLEKRSTDDSI
jgi:uncharacterized membrane protein YjjP (DUF1212 family)